MCILLEHNAVIWCKKTARYRSGLKDLNWEYIQSRKVSADGCLRHYRI